MNGGVAYGVAVRQDIESNQLTRKTRLPDDETNQYLFRVFVIRKHESSHFGSS
jgi:hypothetical protein